MDNLESKIYEFSFGIVEKINSLENNKKKKLFNLIDKALGVLSNDGVYAYFVFVNSQKEKETKEIFIDNLKDIFELCKIEYNSSQPQEYFQNIASNINDLLFLKDLLEKILIYARYHARALDKGE